MASYQLLNSKGEEVKLHDLQDKGPWCTTGSSFEQVFLQKFGTELSLAINPKKAFDIYAPDMVNIQDGNLADLKTQNTPFFKARSFYNIDPQYAVTFNIKDYRRYKEHYPGIEIFFWVSWIPVKFVMGANKVAVNEMEGIWKISLDNIEKLISNGAPQHQYQQRIGDQKGNAKDSYVFNLLDPLFTKLK